MPADGQDNEEQNAKELAAQGLKAGENEQDDGGVPHDALLSLEGAGIGMPAP
ncbi:hypothetical protein S23_38020 [Bradyrhizobium cosmicum]|uniref:Uncharacterized protein n=1 Tax=Bradyrhizobium cosmicum TaxID=1404864 RepID=A0AAI8MFI5_9BRAD|nr:hypothetical protein S23_38020 [Bradyrhizobium cosmicum]